VRRRSLALHMGKVNGKADRGDQQKFHNAQSPVTTTGSSNLSLSPCRISVSRGRGVRRRSAKPVRASAPNPAWGPARPAPLQFQFRPFS
jgi:hypothetical protein